MTNIRAEFEKQNNIHYPDKIERALNPDAEYQYESLNAEWMEERLAFVILLSDPSFTDFSTIEKCWSVLKQIHNIIYEYEKCKEESKE